MQPQTSVDEVPVKPYPVAQVMLMYTEEQHMCIFECAFHTCVERGRGHSDWTLNRLCTSE